MIYKINQRNKERIITVKVNSKYQDLITDEFVLTVPLSMDNKGYKPIQCKIDKETKIMEFVLPTTVDHISAIELIITTAEFILNQLLEKIK